MPIRSVGEVILTRSTLMIDHGPFSDSVQRIVGQTDGEHLLPTQSESDVTDPAVPIKLYCFVVVVLVVAVPQDGLVKRLTADAEVAEGLDLAGARVVVDVERLLSVRAANGGDGGRRAAVAVVLVSEDCVVEIRRACTGESDFLLLGQSSVILVPSPHVEVMTAPGHDGFEESR